MPKKQDFTAQWDDVDTPAEFDSQAAKASIFYTDDLPTIDKQLTIRNDGTHLYGRFSLSPVALVAPEDLTVSEWHDLGEMLLDMKGSIQWWLGDWANLMRETKQWGQMYTELSEKTGFDERTLSNYAWVTRQYPITVDDLSSRKDNLSFSHHLIVASREDRHEILAHAAEQHFSVRRLKKYLQELDASTQDEQVTSLAEQINREYNKIQNALVQGRKPPKTAIQNLRRWLDEIEQL